MWVNRARKRDASAAKEVKLTLLGGEVGKRN